MSRELKVTYRIEYMSAANVRYIINGLPPEAVPVTIHEIEKYNGEILRVDDSEA